MLGALECLLKARKAKMVSTAMAAPPMSILKAAFIAASVILLNVLNAPIEARIPFRNPSLVRDSSVGVLDARSAPVESPDSGGGAHAAEGSGPTADFARVHHSAAGDAAAASDVVGPD